MLKKLGAVAAVVAAAALLGGTVLRAPIAAADNAIQNVIVKNTSANPVPVREQNLDANGNIKVHEQGTAKVQQQGTADVNVVGTVTTQDASHAHPFSLVGNAGFDGCGDNLPAGTQWFLTSVGGANTLPLSNGTTDLTFGPVKVYLKGPGSDVPGPTLEVRSSDTSDMTFPQPFVLTSPADGYCLVMEPGTGIIGVVVGYRQ